MSAIEAADAVIGAEPEKAAGIGDDALDVIEGESVGHGIDFERQLGGVGAGEKRWKEQMAHADQGASSSRR